MQEYVFYAIFAFELLLKEVLVGTLNEHPTKGIPFNFLTQFFLLGNYSM